MASAEAVADVAVVPARKRLGLIGRKLGMTQLLTPEGAAIAVTVIEAGPCVVVQKKTAARSVSRLQAKCVDLGETNEQLRDDMARLQARV